MDSIQEISSFLSNTTNTKVKMTRTETSKKTIGISQEAYDFLKSIGKKGDTFTDCILAIRDRLSK